MSLFEEELGFNMSAGQTGLNPIGLNEMAKQLSTPIYYPEFWRMAKETVGMLGRLMGTNSDILLMTGSATYGIEAGLATCLSEGDKILVANTGVFGQVLAEVGRIIGLDVIEMKVPYGQCPDLEELRKLARQPGMKAIGLVHVETSTGVINPVKEVGRIARELGLLFIVDAVSSVGATEVRVDDWGIDVCFTSSQKALNAPQGMAIVSMGERAWAASRTRRSPIRTLCLDLNVWKHNYMVDMASLDAWERGVVSPPQIGKAIHQPTISWSLLRGLYGSLQAIFQEGLSNVIHRHDVSSKAVRAGVRAMGLDILADDNVACNVVTAVMTPAGVNEIDLRRRMYEDYGIILGAGPLEIGLNCFRIGQMGFVACPRYVLSTLSALEMALKGFGCSIALGAGTRAAQEVFSAEWWLERDRGKQCSGEGEV